MMQYFSESGCSAYWMLHSPTMPRCRTTFRAVARSLKYSVLDSVCDGATTIESPVCTPSGSKFSMLHTVMQLLLQSRTTSYSIWRRETGVGRRNKRTRALDDMRAAAAMRVRQRGTLLTSDATHLLPPAQVLVDQDLLRCSERLDREGSQFRLVAREP